MKKNVILGFIVFCFSTLAYAESMYTTLESGSGFILKDTSEVEWVTVNRAAAKYLFDHKDAKNIIDIETIPNIENIRDNVNSYKFKQIGNWICGKFDRSGAGQRVADFFLLRNEGIGGFYYNCQSIL